MSGMAAAAVAANHAQVQLALAAKLAKSNAASERSVVGLIEAANQNMQTMVKSALAPGVGGTVDISA
ncbi:MAG: hypothetical protein AB7U38_07235 [Hyphomicrobiales bacterium]